MFDNSTFKNERKRVQVVIDLFTIAFFDCQSCSLFDTRIKFDDLDNSNVLIDNIVVVTSFKVKKIVNDVKMNEMNDLKSNRNDNTKMSIDATSEVDNNFNKF